MKKVFRFIKLAVLWFFAITIFLVMVFRFVPVFGTPLMVARAVENLSAGNELEFSHDWVSIEDISPNMQKAVIAAEDRDV